MYNLLYLLMEPNTVEYQTKIEEKTLNG